jgi:hypothetical protein
MGGPRQFTVFVTICGKDTRVREFEFLEGATVADLIEEIAKDLGGQILNSIVSVFGCKERIYEELNRNTSLYEYKRVEVTLEHLIF